MASIHLPIFTKGEWTLCRGFSPFQAVDMLLSSVATASPRRLDQTGTTSLLLATLTDLARSKSELVAENALLRKPLIILRRRVKRPACTKSDRMLLVLLASMVRTWKQALFIVQPETLLRWHRQGLKLFWKYQSRATSATPRISQEPVALIREMARDNRLWGAERIRGELLQLGIRVCKRTIQKSMRAVRPSRLGGQTGKTIVHNHAKDSWACDFLQVTDLCFRSLFAFFIIDLHSRRVIHVGVTRSPTDTWTARTAAGSDSLWTRTARISSEIVITHLVPVLLVWPQPAVSRY
jgi:hypothetical protein